MQTVSLESRAKTITAETQLYAMLDIGSNAMKLAICKFPDRNPCQTVSISERITRLNRGLDEEGVVNDLAIRRLVEAAGELIQEAHQNGAQILGAVGTATLRNTTNKKEVLSRLFHEYGIRTRILTPREEAAAGFIAVREKQRLENNLLNGHGYKPLVTFDLGGRSAEMTFGKDAAPDSFASLELGSSQMSRLAATSDPPVPAEIDHIRYLVREQLKHVDRPLRDAEVYLIGATATTLAGYVPMLFPKQYGLESLDFLDRDIIRELVEKLATMTVSQRKQLPGNPERADIILHGAIALEQTFKYMGFRHAKVSADGVAIGAMISEINGTPLDFKPVHVDLPGIDFRPLTKKDRSGEVLFALRRRDGRIYLQRKIDYPSGIYRIPGGGVDVGENVQEAFWRELYEETSADDVRAIPLASITYSGPDGQSLPFESRLYLVEMEDRDPVPTDSDEGIEDYAPVALENLHLWVSRLQELKGSMEGWGVFRAAAVSTLIDRLGNFPV